MAVFKNIIETIGETPIVRLNKLPVKGAKVYVKIERGNPGGSIKDRAVLSMIDDAEARGVLKTNGTIVEPTSGNTGIAIAMIAAVRGKCRQKGRENNYQKCYPNIWYISQPDEMSWQISPFR